MRCGVMRLRVSVKKNVRLKYSVVHKNSRIDEKNAAKIWKMKKKFNNCSNELRIISPSDRPLSADRESFRSSILEMGDHLSKMA